MKAFFKCFKNFTKENSRLHQEIPVIILKPSLFHMRLLEQALVRYTTGKCKEHSQHPRFVLYCIFTNLY